MNIKYRLIVAKLRLKELLRYDLRSIKSIPVFGVALVVQMLEIIGLHQRVIAWVGSVFNSGWPLSETIARKHILRYLSDDSLKGALKAVMAQHIKSITPLEKTQKFFQHPERFFPHICTILKHKGTHEKGVILLNYSYYFPLFAKLFDIGRIAQDYYIVLEPSWAGCFDKDILCYLNVDAPVFVEAAEPRDYMFIEGLQSNIVPIAIGANWWIDSRKFAPVKDIKKDIDIVMVSAWAEYKRHYSVFKMLRGLRRKNIRLRVALLGHKLDFDANFIKELAKSYGILDQIQIYESLSQDEVNTYFNRSKVNLLWSRFEGFNRSIIEGMFANVPCVMRKDFNYGHRYAYINSSTGAFADEGDLERVILEVLSRQEEFSPRKWVEENMSVCNAIALLETKIGMVAERNGDAWSGGLVKKVNALHGTYYWNDGDYERFQGEYDELKCRIRKN